VLKRAGSNKETEGSGFVICTLLSPNVIRAMGGACGMRWRECIQCLVGYRKEQDGFGDVVVRSQCNIKISLNRMVGL